jgi:hypothetical protein
VRSAGRLGDDTCRAAGPQIATAHDDIDGQRRQALREAAGILHSQQGKRIRVVLVASLKCVGGVRLALAVANNDDC